MSNIKTQQVTMLLGGVDKIVSSLSIQDLPEETQFAIIQRFADIVFKRILLRVPQEHVEEVKRALTDNESAVNMDAFTEVLGRAIPNIDTCIQEEIENTISDFRK